MINTRIHKHRTTDGIPTVDGIPSSNELPCTDCLRSNFAVFSHRFKNSKPDLPHPIKPKIHFILNRNLISFKIYSIYLFPTVCQFIKNALSLQSKRCTAFHFQVDLQICWYNSIVHSKLKKKIAWASKQQPIKNKPEMASFNRFPKFRCWPIYSIVI